MAIVTPWTPELDDVLRDNYGDMPSRQIGMMIGMTKNQVIGRANRLGLADPSRQKKKGAGVTAFTGAPPSACQFPMWGDDAQSNHEYCGQKVVAPGKPYCEAHHKRCFRPIIKGYKPAQPFLQQQTVRGGFV